MIEIDIAPLTVLFCNCLLFYKCSLLVWSTSNHMFGSGNFWDESASWFLKILKLFSFYSDNFKFSKMHLGNLSKTALPSMWLLVLITIIINVINRETREMSQK